MPLLIFFLRIFSFLFLGSCFLYVFSAMLLCFLGEGGLSYCFIGVGREGGGASVAKLLGFFVFFLAIVANAMALCIISYSCLDWGLEL